MVFIGEEASIGLLWNLMTSEWVILSFGSGDSGILGKFLLNPLLSYGKNVDKDWSSSSSVSFYNFATDCDFLT